MRAPAPAASASGSVGLAATYAMCAALRASQTHDATGMFRTARSPSSMCYSAMQTRQETEGERGSLPGLAVARTRAGGGADSRNPSLPGRERERETIGCEFVPPGKRGKLADSSDGFTGSSYSSFIVVRLSCCHKESLSMHVSLRIFNHPSLWICQYILAFAHG